MVVLYQSHTDSKQTYHCIAECAEKFCHVLRRDNLSECDVIGKCVQETNWGCSGLKVCGCTSVLFAQSETAHFVFKTNLRTRMEFGTGAHI
jgi:hypothetical protein